ATTRPHRNASFPPGEPRDNDIFLTVTRTRTFILFSLESSELPSLKMSDPQANEAEKNIEIWKVKKLIKRLEAARGNGTSMISLIIPPKDQISRAAKMLAEEYGTASNIKSRVNRQSVLSAITSTQQRLKLYNKVPPNGLVVYCGEILTSEGKERKVNIDFEPFKPINTSLYLCDNKFHTEALAELLESDQKFGFIIMDGNGALFGTLSGNTREVVHKFSVDLPKKHGRGGQSALRFARLREEKRHNYVRKVAELAVQNFITNDKPNVAGLILAGSADFKTDLNASDLFDNRLATKVIKVVDVSYGGENGFNQAIELSSETLGNVKFIQEKKLIGKYFEEISQDTGRVCYGIDDTLKALELGAVETLIVFENLEITRWKLKDSQGTEHLLHTTKQQEGGDRAIFMDKETGQEMEVISQESFLEWIAEHYKDFGTNLEFVSDRSTEGNQFVKGFGGIGGILRYKVNFEQLADIDDDDEYYDDIFPSSASSASSNPTLPNFPTPPSPGHPLLQGHHLVYFPLQTPPSGLMPDGTDPDHCPGAPFTRRLWAGGEVRFREGWENELRLDGRQVKCIESVDDVRAEKGRVWVELWRRYAAASAVSDKKGSAIEERRTLAFLPEVDAPAPTRRSLRPPHKPTASLTLTPTQNLLTNFSALTYNAHAIHLDPAWASKEGHTATLVHGPLSLALVLAFLNRLGNGQSVRWYGYRNLAPLYCDREMKLCVREKEAAQDESEKERRWDVWIEGEDGGMAVKGTATTVDV
ncbi:eukaryotic peptide chain release factor subunit 1, partial [Colletotrichum tofieldiae]